jgi:hypothetical protein
MSSLSKAAKKILERIKVFSRQQSKPTFRKRTLGNKMLYTKGLRSSSSFKRDWKRT